MTKDYGLKSFIESTGLTEEEYYDLEAYYAEYGSDYELTEEDMDEMERHYLAEDSILNNDPRDIKLEPMFNIDVTREADMSIMSHFGKGMARSVTKEVPVEKPVGVTRDEQKPKNVVKDILGNNSYDNGLSR